ncbi:MAG: type 4b pilus protein PilO2 [Kluyvera sp.]|uniref:type 4b pilus protein PilO2 n=1 Tax=Kluyvera sp. TaxID=1538228 RepID=UPI003F3BD744
MMKKNHKKDHSEDISRQLSLLSLKGRDTAVAGLIWQPIHTVRNIQLEAKSLIQNEKCQYYLTHVVGSRAQCGMTKHLPKGKRCWSAIMLLRESLGDSWLGLFRLPDNRFWLAAIENGVVVPGGDTLFVDEAQARERFRDYEGLFPWQRKYIDGLTNIEGENIQLATVLQKVELKKNYRINFVQEFSRQLKLFVTRGLTVVLILGVAFGGWDYYQQKQEQERLERLRLERLAQLKASGFENGVWKHTSPAREFLSACVLNMSKYPANIVGWSLTDVMCDGKKILTRYKIGKNATSKDFATAMQGLSFQFKKGMYSEVTEKIQVTGSRQQEKLQPINDVASNLLAIFQSGNAKGKMDDVLSSNKKMAKFELATPYSPLAIIKLENMDGVVIRNVKGQLSTQGVLTWYISGEVYGK